ncbi:MAG: hypothetical protein ACR2QS_04980 [Woeseiaceae bacterium]
MTRLVIIRVLPVFLLLVAMAFWFSEVQDHHQYLFRNLLPLTIVLLLSILSVWRGEGRWGGPGLRLAFGTLGFAIPAVGLSVYLHYAYSVNLNDLFTGTESPMQLFRFLPYYTTLAGGIGFAIGWIVGRNL